MFTGKGHAEYPCGDDALMYAVSGPIRSIVGAPGEEGSGLQIDGKDAAQNPRLLQKGGFPWQNVSPCDEIHQILKRDVNRSNTKQSRTITYKKHWELEPMQVE